MIDTTDKKEVYAKFRLSVDNGFRNEFSFIDYRRWGVVEAWSAARLTGPTPRKHAQACIEVWFNWNLVGSYRSYQDARAKIVELLKLAPVNLDDLTHYLD